MAAVVVQLIVTTQGGGGGGSPLSKPCAVSGVRPPALCPPFSLHEFAMWGDKAKQVSPIAIGGNFLEPLACLTQSCPRYPCAQC